MIQTSWLAIGLLSVVVFVLLFLLARKRKETLRPKRHAASDLHLSAVPTFRKTKKDLANELARVRRYGRPLSILVLRLESDQLLLDLKRSLVADTGNGGVESYNQVMQTIQLVFSLVGSILKESLRESDIATYDVPNNQYILMLPESTREQAALTVTRLKKLLFKRTAGHLVTGVAEFPTDGLILEDLISKAVAVCISDDNGSLVGLDEVAPIQANSKRKRRKVDEKFESK